jgi:hypothetical protein
VAQCIFCLSINRQFSSKEHIFPESLGGSEILREEVCDACNAYFGAKVEQFALGTPLMAFWRAFLCLPTKKGRYAEYLDEDIRLSGTDLGIPILGMPEDNLESWFNEGIGVTFCHGVLAELSFAFS